MRFFYKYFANNYEELITYYPGFYKQVYEMNEILKAFGKLSDDLEADIERVYLDNFVLTADAETVGIWEKILRISYKEKPTLDHRKRVIIGRISGGKHIGEPEIRAVISNYSDRPASVDFHDGIIEIELTGEIFDDDNFLGTLLAKIPAHLRLKVDIHIKKRFEWQINVHGGGGISAYIYGLPVQENRHERYDTLLSYGAYMKNTGLARPPDVKDRSVYTPRGVGSAYCRTHIKTKLIE